MHPLLQDVSHPGAGEDVGAGVNRAGHRRADILVGTRGDHVRGGCGV